jgi:TctA family transporter
MYSEKRIIGEVERSLCILSMVMVVIFLLSILFTRNIYYQIISVVLAFVFGATAEAIRRHAL